MVCRSLGSYSVSNGFCIHLSQQLYYLQLPVLQLDDIFLLLPNNYPVEPEQNFQECLEPQSLQYQVRYIQARPLDPKIRVVVKQKGYLPELILIFHFLLLAARFPDFALLNVLANRQRNYVVCFRH